MTYTPPSIKFSVSVTPGTGGEALSFLDVNILSSTGVGYPGLGVTDGWCLDRSVSIYSSIPSGWYYQGNVYSSTELGVLAGATPTLSANLLSHLDALDSVNWLLNAYYTNSIPASWNGTAVTASWQNVQGAVWTLLGSNPAVSDTITGGDAAQIAALANEAATLGNGYIAEAGQYTGVTSRPRCTRPVARCTATRCNPWSWSPRPQRWVISSGTT